MKRIFIILFLSLLVSGAGIDDVYAAKSKSKSGSSKSGDSKKKQEKKQVTRPTGTSKVKKKDDKKKVETAAEKKKRLEAEKKAAELKNNTGTNTKSSLTRPTGSSTIKGKDGTSKNQTTTVPKLNASQKSAVDKKLSKHKALKGKTFKSKKEAETAYRKSLSNQTYDKEPDVMPDHVPRYREINGQRYETDFYNGRYGYRNSSGVFVVYDDDDFLVDALVLTALTTPRVQHVQTPQVVHVDRKPTNENDAKIVLYILLFIGFIVVAVIVGVIITKMKGGS